MIGSTTGGWWISKREAISTQGMDHADFVRRYPGLFGISIKAAATLDDESLRRAVMANGWGDLRRYGTWWGVLFLRWADDSYEALYNWVDDTFPKDSDTIKLMTHRGIVSTTTAQNVRAYKFESVRSFSWLVNQVLLLEREERDALWISKNGEIVEVANGEGHNDAVISNPRLFGLDPSADYRMEKGTSAAHDNGWARTSYWRGLGHSIILPGKHYLESLHGKQIRAWYTKTKPQPNEKVTLFYDRSPINIMTKVSDIMDGNL